MRADVEATLPSLDFAREFAHVAAVLLFPWCTGQRPLSALTSSKKSQKTHKIKVISYGSLVISIMIVSRCGKNNSRMMMMLTVRSPPLLMVVYSPFFPLACGASSLLVALSLLLAPLPPTGTLNCTHIRQQHG